jgi:ElaB/YqjD/DUF883 family membrane-anchored ribosome-binding protein
VLGDSYTKAREQFDDYSGDVRKGVKAAAKRLEKDYGDVWDDVLCYVKDNPGTAVAVCLGVGFVLGFILRGGDD